MEPSSPVENDVREPDWFSSTVSVKEQKKKKAFCSLLLLRTDSRVFSHAAFWQLARHENDPTDWVCEMFQFRRI